MSRVVQPFHCRDGLRCSFTRCGCKCAPCDAARETHETARTKVLAEIAVRADACHARNDGGCCGREGFSVCGCDCHQRDIPSRAALHRQASALLCNLVEGRDLVAEGLLRKREWWQSVIDEASALVVATKPKEPS